MRTLAALWLLAAGFAFAEPPSVETLFKPPQFALMRISPDGASIAALAPVAGRQNLVILDTKTHKPTPVTGFTDRDVVDLRWVNSKRLLVQTGSIGTRVFDYKGGGLFAIDKDGSEGRMISEGGADEQSSSGALKPLIPVRGLPGDSDDLIAQEIIPRIDGTHPGELVRVNTRTGRRTNVGFPKADSGEGESWVADDKGVGRVQVVDSQGKVRIYYRANADAPWQKLDEYPELSSGWYPVAVADDDKTLIVVDRHNRDKAAIARYDPATKTFGEVLAEHPQVDLSNLIRDQGRVVGVAYEADRGGSAYFEEDLAKIKSAIDRALPNTVNGMNWSRDRSLILVTAYSDVNPGSYYLLDMKAGKMEWLVDRKPWIKPKEMAPMQPVRYTARDGLPIPAYLTLPKDSNGKNLPLVMVIHGGPWVDGDEWGFDPEAQFLATRGYAVLQPNFRGTTHYGWKHLEASFGQWGLAMQDDITDGVKWAVEQGIADPKRVCIYGASYGGYATMMGLAKTPELYRCGVNYVGVTDVNLYLTATWTDYSQSDAAQYAIKGMVGDASKDAEKIKAVSPVALASRIKAPVLMAYGAADVRVPIEHGQRMRSALESAGNKPIWIVADGEGHGFREMANQKMFYEAMEKFLAENLK